MTTAIPRGGSGIQSNTVNAKALPKSKVEQVARSANNSIAANKITNQPTAVGSN